MRPGQVIDSKKERRKRAKEYVHGLEVLTPLKDYDFAYLLAALKAYRQKCTKNGNRAGVWWADHLTRKLRRYFAALIRETKRENHRLKEIEAKFTSLEEFVKAG